MAKLAARGRTLAVGWDISDLAHVETALAQTEAELGPVDIVVSSARIAGPNGSVTFYDAAAWNHIVAINLTGTFHVNKVVISSMKARNYGRIPKLRPRKPTPAPIQLPKPEY